MMRPRGGGSNEAAQASGPTLYSLMIVNKSGGLIYNKVKIVQIFCLLVRSTNDFSLSTSTSASFQKNETGVCPDGGLARPQRHPPSRVDLAFAARDLGAGVSGGLGRWSEGGRRRERRWQLERSDFDIDISRRRRCCPAPGLDIRPPLLPDADRDQVPRHGLPWSSGRQGAAEQYVSGYLNLSLRLHANRKREK